MFGLLQDGEARTRVAELEHEQESNRNRLRLLSEDVGRLEERHGDLIPVLDRIATVLDNLADIDRLQGLRLSLIEASPPERTYVQTLAVLAVAVEAEQVVQFHYTDSTGAESAREVSPYTIQHAGRTDALLVGFDHVRNDIRRFRVDRIGELAQQGLFEFVHPEVGR